MVNSRTKGKRGELELRDVLREEGWVHAQRGQQRSGLEQADVVGGPEGIHFEVKRVERLDLRGAVAQARQDAGEGELPVVAHRRDRERDWLVTLDLRAFLRAVALLEQLGLDFPHGETVSRQRTPDR